LITDCNAAQFVCIAYLHVLPGRFPRPRAPNSKKTFVGVSETA
jgi:hypothetical protein